MRLMVIIQVYGYVKRLNKKRVKFAKCVKVFMNSTIKKTTKKVYDASDHRERSFWL